MSDGQVRTDGERLRAFIREGDEVAFEAVVNMHGPMVFRVCHGILDDPHEAEDTTQAVFLVLARKASRLEGDVSVAPWLHRVAHDLAVDTLRRRQSRRLREEESAKMNPPQPAGQEPMTEERIRLLHEQIGELPERYRAPVVMCYLEGQQAEVAAQALGLAPATLRKRLERGRDRLRSRLGRLGWIVPAGALTTLLSAEAGAAVLPPEFVSATAKAANLAAAGNLAAGVGTGVVSANVAALTKGACNMLFWSSAKTAAVAVAASVAVVGGGAIMAQQVAQRKTADSGEVILRAAEIPISVKDAKGEIYVAVPKSHFDDGKSQMWSFGAGMTDFYRRLFRLTEKEQAEMQVLLEEAWGGADVLERCFTVTQDAQSVTAELRDADAVHLLQDVELRLRTNFLHKAAGVLGPGRAEVMNWFTASSRDIVPWPLSARPGSRTTRYSMKLSRASGVSSGGIRFEIDTEGALAGSPWDGGLSSSDGKAAAKGHLVHVSSLTPWPALGARLGVSREAALAQVRANRARYAQRMRDGTAPDAPYRSADSPLAPPPIGCESESGDMRGVYVAMSLAAWSNPLNWLTAPPASTSAARSADTPTDRYTLNPAWGQVLRLRSVPEDQSQLLAGIFHRTLAAMNEACAEGLTVTHKPDGKVVCVVRADALAKFSEILDRQHREVKAALGSEEKAEIVRTVVTALAPIPGNAAELLWKLRTVGKEDVRFEVEKEEQTSSSGDVLYIAQVSAGKFGWGGRLLPREHLPAFLAPLLPAK